MIYGFYFRFLKFTKSQWFSIFLSKIAYALHLACFLIKRLSLVKSDCSVGVMEARELIERTYPDPMGRATAVNPEIEKELDLSIVVPVYNYVSLIEKSVESILQQKTKYRFQLILVDDGSTDGAKEIMMRYQSHPQVRIRELQGQEIVELIMLLDGI